MNTNYIFDKILTLYSAKFYGLLILDFSQEEDVFGIICSLSLLPFLNCNSKCAFNRVCFCSELFFSFLDYLQNIEVNGNKNT